MASNGNISHAEMWDDSALVDSWNDALDEYKKYHSIAARGENEDEILLRADNRHPEMHEATAPEEEELKKPSSNDQHAKDEASRAAANHDRASSQTRAQSNSMRSSSAQAPNGPPALPQHLIGQVQDEGLKHLLMSWYYAGYYTGLYEGQKQERAGGSSKPET